VDLHGDKAAWKLVDANGSLVQEVRFDIHYPDDINTPADFERLVTTGNEH
jgi:CTP:molybdopterin cytidylyltransferase MocA